MIISRIFGLVLASISGVIDFKGDNSVIIVELINPTNIESISIKIACLIYVTFSNDIPKDTFINGHMMGEIIIPPIMTDVEL
ncbi:MAG: hypothetical protein BWY21_02085 [Parcubacteria group bacterium ADurb.Bin216]|nr:MAG: hypothetical protein BWY21_02085 [Parcubacteria group bacterium ADurb.Bin216]